MRRAFAAVILVGVAACAQTSGGGSTDAADDVVVDAGAPDVFVYVPIDAGPRDAPGPDGR